MASSYEFSLRAQKDKATSPFLRVGRGLYSLRGSAEKVTSKAAIAAEPESTSMAGLINALGMFWERSRVYWTLTPKLLGQATAGSQPLDFTEQKGVYLLHDSQGVVYVGRTMEQNLGRRLYQHTIDRLRGRWDRFSWFGVYPVNENGSLRVNVKINQISIDTLITTMEAILIEGLEPRQNRKRGDDFLAVEYLQQEDPQIQQERRREVVKQIAAAVV